MNPDEVTGERLAGWRLQLAKQTATPIALIGIGQGANKGKVVLCIPENGPTRHELAELLRGVAAQLERQ